MKASHRAGFAYRRYAIMVALASGLLVTSVVVLARVTESASNQAIAVYHVQRAEFVHEVELRGTLESASNVEVRCRVENQNPSRGSMILEVVPEGTYVQPGDVLVRLDSSALEEKRQEREALCERGKADFVRYQGEVEGAKKNLESYQFGTLVRQKQAREMDVFEAEEKFRQASQRLESSRNLYQRGFVTKIQLQADQFGVDRAEVDLKMAKLDLTVLTDFTAPRYILRYERYVEFWKHYLTRFEYILQLRDANLKEVEAQIEKCTIRAPAAGQVVYANQAESSYGPVVIEEGAHVRYNQVVMHLPDPKNMLVRTKVDESRVSWIKPGSRVEVSLEAMPGQTFLGTVKTLNDLPEPAYYWAPSVNQYEMTVDLEGEPEDLRTGWTALAKVCIERSPDQLQVPVDAVFELDHRHFCVVKDGKGVRAREVKIGTTNGKTIVVRGGLEPGEDVVLGAAAYRNQVELPEPVRNWPSEMMVATPSGTTQGSG